MFRLPSGLWSSSNNIKKINEIKIKWNFFSSKIWNFLNENHPPTRHIKYKKRDFEWYKKFRQKWLVKKSKFVWRKKNPPRAQIFRYFRIESRNKNCLSYKKNKWVTMINIFPCMKIVRPVSFILRILRTFVLSHNTRSIDFPIEKIHWFIGNKDTVKIFTHNYKSKNITFRIWLENIHFKILACFFFYGVNLSYHKKAKKK